MAWNGSGTFSRTNGTNTGATLWAADAAAATKITTARHDTQDEDIATAITACLTKNGESKATADFVPNASDTYDLGTTSLKWEDLHLNGNGLIGGTLGVTGVVTVGGVAQPSLPAASTDHLRAGHTQLWIGDGAPDTGVSNGLFDEGDITEATETTVGPTGSGATFIWTVMDLIPSNATMLIVDVQLNNSASTIADATLELRFYEGNQTYSANGVTKVKVFSPKDNPPNEDNHRFSSILVPLASDNQDFKFYWNETALTTTSFDVIYRGFMTD